MEWMSSRYITLLGPSLLGQATSVNPRLGSFPATVLWVASPSNWCLPPHIRTQHHWEASHPPLCPSAAMNVVMQQFNAPLPLPFSCLLSLQLTCPRHLLPCHPTRFQLDQIQLPSKLPPSHKRIRSIHIRYLSDCLLLSSIKWSAPSGIPTQVDPWPWQHLHCLLNP